MIPIIMSVWANNRAEGHRRPLLSILARAIARPRPSMSVVIRQTLGASGR